MVIILHPKVERPHGFRGGDEDVAPAVFMAIETEIDFQEELSCFYCGKEQVMFLSSCPEC